jgi:hypothetical protein
MPGKAHAAAMGFDGQEFAAVIEGQGLGLYDAESGKLRLVLDSEKGAGSLAYDPLGNYILWHNVWRRVRVLHVEPLKKVVERVSKKAAAFENKKFHRRNLRVTQVAAYKPERQVTELERFDERWAQKQKAIDVLTDRIYSLSVPVSGSFQDGLGYRVNIASRSFIAQMEKEDAEALGEGRLLAILRVTRVNVETVRLEPGAELINPSNWNRYPLIPSAVLPESE